MTLLGHPSSVRATIDLDAIRTNAARIRAQTNVDLLAVVKADAYGHGAREVSRALADLVDGWYVLFADEAIDLRDTNRPTICGATRPTDSADALRSLNVRPAVATREQLDRFRALDPILSIDTGMQRFACPAGELDAMLAAHPFREAMTHAVAPEAAERFGTLTDGRTIRRHAAGSALLGVPAARFDAVRPGFALYADAARVVAPLAEVHRSRGPVGYTGFAGTTHHGVILAGYSGGLRTGPCSVNGRPQRIVEVGMQTAYVSLDPSDRAGDEVELLGPTVRIDDVVVAWGRGAYEVMYRLVSMGERDYRNAEVGPTNAFR